MYPVISSENEKEVCNLIRLRVLDILEEQGKTKYWLFKQLPLSYQNLNRMLNNDTKSIRYENIERLCKLLHCTPGDLFEISEEPDVPNFATGNHKKRHII